MARQIAPRRPTLDILILAWIVSILPLTLAFAHSAPGFPDVAPAYDGTFYLCLSLFIWLQCALGLTIANRLHAATWWTALLAICASLFALLPEVIAFFFMLLLWPIALIACSVIVIVLLVRIMRRSRAQHS